MHNGIQSQQSTLHTVRPKVYGHPSIARPRFCRCNRLERGCLSCRIIECKWEKTKIQCMGESTEMDLLLGSFESYYGTLEFEEFCLDHDHAISLSIFPLAASWCLKRVLQFWGFIQLIFFQFMNRFVVLDHLGRPQISHLTHSARVLMLVANCSLDPCGPSVMNINEGKFTSWSSWFEAD